MSGLIWRNWYIRRQGTLSQKWIGIIGTPNFVPVYPTSDVIRAYPAVLLFCRIFPDPCIRYEAYYTETTESRIQKKSRALGYLFSDRQSDYYAPDPFKCIFFQNGWYEKICSTLQPWTNLKPL